jgi:hypothetical protein
MAEDFPVKMKHQKATITLEVLPDGEMFKPFGELRIECAVYTPEGEKKIVVSGRATRAMLREPATYQHWAAFIENWMYDDRSSQWNMINAQIAENNAKEKRRKLPEPPRTKPRVPSPRYPSHPRMK